MLGKPSFCDSFKSNLYIVKIYDIDGRNHGQRKVSRGPVQPRTAIGENRSERFDIASLHALNTNC